MPNRGPVFLYWIAVAMALISVILVVASQWALIWSFELAGIPLPWLSGGVAIAAILLYEFCASAGAIPAGKLPEAKHQIPLEFKQTRR